MRLIVGEPPPGTRMAGALASRAAIALSLRTVGRGRHILSKLRDGDLVQ